LCDSIANFSLTLMNYFERMRLLSYWQKLNYRLHQYWYLRGLMIKAGSAKKLYQIMEVKSGAGITKIEPKRRPVKYTRNAGRRRSRV